VTLFAPTIPWLLLGVGALLGVLAGLIQLRALRESMSSLLAAKSAVGVRRALSGSRYGRMYLYFLDARTGLCGESRRRLARLGGWRLYIQGGAGVDHLAGHFRA
jgi:hypothetical protein